MGLGVLFMGDDTGVPSNISSVLNRIQCILLPPAQIFACYKYSHLSRCELHAMIRLVSPFTHTSKEFPVLMYVIRQIKEVGTNRWERTDFQ